MDRRYEKLLLGELKVTGTNAENFPIWSINHYVEEFCNNYNKILIIRRICELIQYGAYADQFIVAKQSAILYPTKDLKPSFKYSDEKYISLSSKSDNLEKFWHII